MSSSSSPSLSTLEECELLLELDRLDNPEYFSADFCCPPLTDFFKKIVSEESIQENKVIINHYFDRLLDIGNPEKSFYSRVKWLIVLHSIIQSKANKILA